MSRKLYRIMTPDQWDETRILGVFNAAEYEKEGQTYACYLYQTQYVAGFLYNGELDLSLVELDPSKLGVGVEDKNLQGGEELFPHILGQIPAEACIKVFPLPVEGDGSFELPNELQAEFSEQMKELETV